MLASWNPWLRSLYLYLTQGTSTSVEWAWLIGRLAVAIIAVPATYATFDGFDGASAVPFAAVGVVVYSALLAFLLRRGYSRLTFLVGFLLDNVIIVVAWWLIATGVESHGAENDLWLILLPVTVVGIARTGPWLGLGYVALMSILLGWMTLRYQPIDSYAVTQLPVRLVFFGIVGAITTWLVAQLNIERESAEDLQQEAEILSEISQIVGTSLNPADVFPKFTGLMQILIPYQILVLGQIDPDQSNLEVLNIDGSTDRAIASKDVVNLPADGEMLKWLTLRGPQLLDEDACERLSAIAGDDGQRLVSGARSMIISAVVSGDSAVGTLFASSPYRDAFSTDHVRVLARVAELIGSAMTNLQVYSQDIQLANERAARLTLDAANRRLQEDNEARSFFLSAVSHELRTPLTSIIAFNDLLLRNKNDNLTEREIQQLQLISRNSKQLATLVNDLLDLSYIDSGKVQLTPESFNPAEAIKVIVESVEPMLKVKSQKLNWGPQLTDESVVADKERFAQVVANLLSNASKYSDQKGEIDLNWSVQGGNFEMTVRDHGTGISEIDQDRLFQPFFRAAQQRTDKIPGTGLGLVIVESLLEAHGGGVSIHSSQETGEGSGTEARIWFPADGSVLTGNSRLSRSA